MVGHFNISKANPNDLNLLVHLMQFTWKATYPALCKEEPKRVERMFSRDSIKEQITSENYCILILRDENNKAIGYARMQFIFSGNHHFYPSKPKAYLEQIYLLKEAQGIGYGKYLLQRCFLAAIKKNINQMFLQVVDDNKSAQEFYLKHGFKYETMIKDLYPTMGAKLYYGYRMCCDDLRTALMTINESIHYSNIGDQLKAIEEEYLPYAKL